MRLNFPVIRTVLNFRTLGRKKHNNPLPKWKTKSPQPWFSYCGESPYFHLGLAGAGADTSSRLARGVLHKASRFFRLLVEPQPLDIRCTICVRASKRHPPRYFTHCPPGCTAERWFDRTKFSHSGISGQPLQCGQRRNSGRRRPPGRLSGWPHAPPPSGWKTETPHCSIFQCGRRRSQDFDQRARA